MLHSIPAVHTCARCKCHLCSHGWWLHSQPQSQSLPPVQDLFVIIGHPWHRSTTSILFSRSLISFHNWIKSLYLIKNLSTNPDTLRISPQQPTWNLLLLCVPSSPAIQSCIPQEVAAVPLPTGWHSWTLITF